jgi:hypothetical protein
MLALDALGAADADYWAAFGAGLVIGLVFAAVVWLAREPL